MFGDRSPQLLEVQQIVIWYQRTCILFSAKFCRPCCTSRATCSSNLLKQIQVQMVSSPSVNYHKPNKHKLFGMAEELSAGKSVLQAKKKKLFLEFQKKCWFISCAGNGTNQSTYYFCKTHSLWLCPMERKSKQTK